MHIHKLSQVALQGFTVVLLCANFWPGKGRSVADHKELHVLGDEPRIRHNLALKYLLGQFKGGLYTWSRVGT